MNIQEILKQELYVEERIVPEGKRHIVLFDIDDTLLSAENIYIHKVFPDGKDILLSPIDFAKEDIVKEGEKGISYDMKEFRDPNIVKKSIETGRPIWKNLKIINDHIKNGWKIGIITARGLEDVIYSAINKWAMFQQDKGLLDKFGKIFVKNLVHAVNDEAKVYEGANSFEKKANVIKKYAQKYDKVKFVDDDDKNIKAVRDLKMPNVIVVKAWEKE